MLPDRLSNRWFQLGLVFFVLVVGGGLLYSWYALRTTESEMERHDRFLQGREKQNETRPAETVIVPPENETSGLVSTPDKHSDTPRPEEVEALPKETDNLDLTDAFLPDDFVSEEAPAEDVPVSPYGFGPYPELPPEFRENYWEGMSMGNELIARVWMKLLEQGIEVTGGSIQNGLVYPNIRGTIYIEWDGVGTERYISRMMGDPDTIRRFRNLHDPDAYPLQPLREKDIPAGITVINYPDGGIDPYQFLDLKKE